MKMTQCDRVLEYLQEHRSISQVEAYEHFGITRLGARIWDLRKHGHTIIASRETGTNRFGEPTHYARYSLVA